MNIRKAGCLSLFGLVFAAFAGGANAADCATAQFSDTVLERFPNIASACQDVIEKDGQMYAVIKSDLVRTDRDALFVRVQMPDGSRSQTRRIPVSRDFRVVINGRPVGLDQVAVGQELGDGEVGEEGRLLVDGGDPQLPRAARRVRADRLAVEQQLAPPPPAPPR